jgi:thermitase
MIARRLAVALVLVCGLLPAPSAATAPRLPRPDASAFNRLIVVLKPAAIHQERPGTAMLLDQFAARGLRDLAPLGVDGPLRGAPAYLGALAPGADGAALLADLAHSPLVLRVEPDVPRQFFAIDPTTGPLDAEFGLQHYYFDIGVVAMWARGLTGISATNPITVAVIDTGVDLSHPDINANLVPGFDFVEMDTTPQDSSLDSHGSMVAGVIGAEMNNDIVSGVARGVAGIGGGDAQAGTSGLRVMPLRVAADSSEALDCAQVAQAIDYARTHAAQVINMSFGGPDSCALELDAVQRAYDAGIALVAGAGNNNSSTPFYPAAYGAGTNDRLVLAVAGVYSDRVKADASNYGTWVDVCAPFRLIRSITNSGSYASASGTSFSAPFVSGLVGVLISNYHWSRDKAFWKIQTTADNVDAANPNYIGQLGAGRINADRASALIYDTYLPLALR